MNRKRAREILRGYFPCNIFDHPFRSYEELRKKDPKMVKDILDYIEWNQPLPYKITEYRRIDQ